MYRISYIITMKYKRKVAELNRFIDSMDEDSKRNLKQTLMAAETYCKLHGVTMTDEETYVNQLCAVQSFIVIYHTLSGDDKYRDYLQGLWTIMPASLMPFMRHRMDATFMRLVLKEDGVDTTNMAFL